MRLCKLRFLCLLAIGLVMSQIGSSPLGATAAPLELEEVADDRDRANIFEEAREFVPDALGRVYLELTGKLD